MSDILLVCHTVRRQYARARVGSMSIIILHLQLIIFEFIFKNYLDRFWI